MSEICPHCSGVPTNHRVDYLTAVIDNFFEKYLGVLEWIRKKLRPLFVRQTIHKIVFTLLPWRLVFSLPLAGRDQGLPAGQAGRGKFDNNRQKVLYESAKERGIDLYRFFLFGMPTEVFAARKGNQIRMFFTMPRPLRVASESFDWIDNKEIFRQKFEKMDFPVPKGNIARSKREALEIFEALDAPVIVKPSRSSRGRHVRTNIDGRQNLSEAFVVARQICPWVVVEEHLPGVVHRITMIDGKIAGVIRKEYPQVLGNGRSTVRELVASENLRPERQGPIFYTIKIDEYTEAELRRQDLSWESVPPENQPVVLYNKPGRQLGSTNTDVTDDMHPDNMDLFLAIGEYLAEPLVGIDFMIEDISRSHREQKCGVIECNTMPFIDIHHHPYKGQPRDVAGKLWDIVFE